MTFPLSQTTTFTTQSDPYTHLVQQIMRVEDITWGGERDNYLVRYHGQIIGDTSEAYDRLAASLRPNDVTPLFRLEEGRHTVILVKGVVRPRPSNPLVNLLLFGLTLLSVLFAGTFFSYEGPISRNLSQMLPYLWPALKLGLAFTVSLLAILTAHEFGHYLAARYHKTHVTLPYFIPFPISPFGTMGAFIQLKESPKNKRVLLDIGIAGPLAGLIVAIPILLYGLSISSIGKLPTTGTQTFQMEGNSLLYLLAKFLVFGRLLPHPVNYGGVSPLLYWLRYVFTGLPVPFGGTDVMLHPVAWAGWAGLLVTALNLIPAGQLDGGHALYVLFGKKARAILPFLLIGLIVLGVVWSGWWLWAFLIFFLGRVYAEPLDQITPLDPSRRALAILVLIVFVLVFTPVPLIQFGA